MLTLPATTTPFPSHSPPPPPRLLLMPCSTDLICCLLPLHTHPSSRPLLLTCPFKFYYPYSSPFGFAVLSLVCLRGRMRPAPSPSPALTCCAAASKAFSLSSPAFRIHPLTPHPNLCSLACPCPLCLPLVSLLWLSFCSALFAYVFPFFFCVLCLCPALVCGGMPASAWPLPLLFPLLSLHFLSPRFSSRSALARHPTEVGRETGAGFSLVPLLCVAHYTCNYEWKPPHCLCGFRRSIRRSRELATAAIGRRIEQQKWVYILNALVGAAGLAAVSFCFEASLDPAAAPAAASAGVAGAGAGAGSGGGGMTRASDCPKRMVWFSPTVHSRRWSLATSNTSTTVEPSSKRASSVPFVTFRSGYCFAKESN
jgi:hypothetical protein